MASVEMKITQWNQRVLDELAAKGMLAGGEALKLLIAHELDSGGHTDTGKLKNSFNVSLEYGSLGPEVTVSTNSSYASFVNDGTSDTIYPTSARVLRFKPGKKGSYLGKRGQYNAKSTGRFSSDYLYRPSVSGQKATHFFDKAVDQLRITDFII